MRLLQVGPLDPGYPAGLHLAGRAPLLWWRGTLGPDGERCVAVVGTRSPSPAGLARARSLARELAGAGVTVVSGLARGIDTAAHEACLDAGGRSIAVLGSGIGEVYPPENAGLADRIAAHGAVLSQLPPDAQVSPGALRRRNAVIAALAAATVVVEAGPTSGARITARCALDLGRHLLLSDLVAGAPWARALLTRAGVCRLAPDAGVEPLLARLVGGPPTAPVQLALAVGAGW
jgi:DNA processing protein